MQRANLLATHAANQAARPTRASLRLCLAIALPILLGACQNMRTVNDANARVQSVHKDIERLRAERNTQTRADGTEAVNGLPMLEEHKGAWIARGSVAIDESDVIPARFYEAASFNSSRPLPLSMVAEQIGIEQKVLIHLSSDVLKPPAGEDRRALNVQDGSLRTEPKIHLNFRGTLRGLLDTVAMRSGTYWTYREGAIQFSRYKTRTFQIASMPGKSNYSAQVGNKTSTDSSSSGSGSSGSGAMQMGTGGMASVSTQTDLSYWDEATTTIQSMLSPAGKSTSSTVTNSITVTDTADVIDKIRRFVDRENAVLGRQVHLRVQVYSVKLKTGSQSGIDWNLAFETTGLKVGMGLGDVAKDSVGATWLRSPWKDSRLMIAALQTQGDVSTVIDTSVVTLNNQPAPIAITNNMTYIAKVSVSELNSSSGSSGRMFTVEPGMLTTGFILNLMPTLLDNRSVMLQVQLNLSSLISKEKVDLGKNAEHGHITTPETSAIQTLQRASLKSDETLILTGFRRDNNDNKRRGLFDLATGYSQTERQQEEVVVLITPQLVEGV